MATFFTADTHFGHGRIIQYCNRPFQNAKEQDDAILTRFNEVLKPGDTLYHLGDVAWSTTDIKKEFLDKLPTKEVHLITGNHDNQMDSAYLKMGFRSVQAYKEITLDKVHGSIGINGTSTRVVLFHYPMRSWHHGYSGAYHLFGHVHGQMDTRPYMRSLDVGVDSHQFTPWSWDEIKEELKDRTYGFDSDLYGGPWKKEDIK